MEKPQPPRFNENLVPSDVSPFHAADKKGKLLELEGHPHHVVRVETFDALERRYKRAVTPVEVATMGGFLYEELESKYGIQTPVHFFVGKDADEHDMVYARVDKIRGENLSKAIVTDELGEKVAALYATLARYLADRQQGTGEAYLTDIMDPTQYVYGTREGEEEPKIYLVDTDLYIRDGKYALYQVIKDLVQNVIAVERHYKKELIEARKILQELLARPLPPELPENGKERTFVLIREAQDALGFPTSELSGEKLET